MCCYVSVEVEAEMLFSDSLIAMNNEASLHAHGAATYSITPLKLQTLTFVSATGRIQYTELEAFHWHPWIYDRLFSRLKAIGRDGANHKRQDLESSGYELGSNGHCWKQKRPQS